MIYDTIVKGNDSFFKAFIEVSSRINEEQIFSRAFQNGFNEQDVEDLHDDILSIYSTFNKEKRNLNRSATTYNQQYATDCNGCYSDVAGYCFLIRRTMKKQLDLFKKFCVTNKRKPPVVDGKSVSLSALEHSDMGAMYTQKLIPFTEDDMIPVKLKELANLIIKFNNEVVDCVLLCIQIMKDEMMIRKDYPQLRWIYDNTISELKLKSPRFIGNIIQCPDSLDKVEDSMTREMLQTETEKWNEILAKYFHKRTPTELLLHHLLFTTYKEKYAFISTPMERKLWGEDVDKIKKIRTIIKYLDGLKPKGQKDSETGNIKLSGKCVAKLMHWAIRGHGIAMKDFVDYFNEEYRGSYQKIEYATIMAAYSGLKKEEKDACVIEFENFLNRKAEEKKQKIA